eukprot:SM000022S07148  [mRNA]  locus=s22:202957:208318:+ [translate_table: standard]
MASGDARAGRDVDRAVPLPPSQATSGPCNTAKPWGWSVVESAKWQSWKNLGNMPPVEAMRLFVRTLEEEDPDWWQRSLEEAQQAKSQAVDSQAAPAEVPGSPTVNGMHPPAEAPALAKELTSLAHSDEWLLQEVVGRKPPPRYQHAATLLGRKMYVVGGNCNGRYLNDVQILDLSSLTWSKADYKPSTASLPPPIPLPSSLPPAPPPLPPCAGHSLITWGRTLLVIGGHTKDPSQTVTVRAFDTEALSWSELTPGGDIPVARGGQSVTRAGSSLVMFGGEDSRRRLLNDVHNLNLNTMTWSTVDTKGTRPPPRSDHAATLHNDRYLLVFGGGSHSNCYNDLHILDLETMEWSQPQQDGALPSPRAGHAGIKVDDKWYVIGGGDNKSGVAGTAVLDLTSMQWSKVTVPNPKSAIASEVGFRGGLIVWVPECMLPGLNCIHEFASRIMKLSVYDTWAQGLSVSYLQEDGGYLIAFGGYNGRYSNEVHVFRPIVQAKPPAKILESAAAAKATSVAASPQQQVNGGPAQAELGMSAQGPLPSKPSVSRPPVKPLPSEAATPVEEPHQRPRTEEERLYEELQSSQRAKEEAETALAEAHGQLVTAQVATSGAQAENARLKKDLVAATSSLAEAANELSSAKSSLAEKADEVARLKERQAEVARESALAAAAGADAAEVAKLRKELAAAKAALADTEQELQSARGALAGEQSRCFRLEVEVAELRQKLQGMEALEKELELLQRQKAASEEAAATAAAQKNNQPGMWSWLAGAPPEKA